MRVSIGTKSKQNPSEQLKKIGFRPRLKKANICLLRDLNLIFDANKNFQPYLQTLHKQVSYLKMKRNNFAFFSTCIFEKLLIGKNMEKINLVFTKFLSVTGRKSQN